MVRRLVAGSCVFLLLVAAVFADETADRNNLTGKWQGPSGKDQGEIWSIETVGDSLRLTHLVKQKTDEFACNIMGHECDVKLAGKHVKVSLWFNGAMLVDLETRGSEIVKRRFKAMDPNTLQVETFPINPGGKSATELFKRVAMSAERK